jgi:hypothetical protein
MPQYKDFLIIHPKKGNIKLGKLSHNELCRYCFNLILECSRLQQELKIQVEKPDESKETE